MTFKIREATPEDGAAIAKIWLAGDDEFLQLQLGTVSPSVLNDGMEFRLAESIRTSGQVYVIAEDDESGEIVSYASWTLPRSEDEPVVEQSDEEKADATEAYRQKLLPGMNAALTMDFREAMFALRDRAIKGRRCYMLGNLGTLPWYQRRGAASALLRWPFGKADAAGVIVYLDTDEQGVAKPMYEKSGFKKDDEAVFNLDNYGSEGTHTHIAMVREPQVKV